jgi:NhaA family Na+:H+ antiporter
MGDRTAHIHPRPTPPGTWRPARRFVRAVAAPIERFLRIEAASGILLMTAAFAAFVWASSPWRESYERLWSAPIALRVGSLAVDTDARFLVNDGLMVIFFFVVGLEIRREVHSGALADARRAALPLAAALGGMIAPAAIYVAWNHHGPATHGWGVPMATDIAFALGALALLGDRVPHALRVLLLALAIVDDIGAIVVIALFYAHGLHPAGAVVAVAGLAFVFALRAVGVRRPVAYVVPGVVFWAGTLATGVHPTIAGVVLGLLTPVQPWYGTRGFVTTMERAVAELRERARGEPEPRELLPPLERVAEARREAVPPAVRLQAALHPWVAFVIMPLFALANAGVDVRGVDLGDPDLRRIALGVGLGLLLGKPIGVIGASLLTERLGLAARPRDVDARGLTVLGTVAGIGFTMAIFIATLAFPDEAHARAAKMAVLASSMVAGVLSLIAGRVLLREPR